jgi:orotate phosphoribosyltransferase
MKRFLRDMLKQHAYRFSKEPFKLKSGRESNHYVDCKKVLLHPLFSTQAAALLNAWVHLTLDDIDGVAGVVLGGVPLVNDMTALELIERNRIWDRLYVRSEAKDHGTQRLVEVDFEFAIRQAENDMTRVRPPPKVVLVEDVWTTGGSARAAKEALLGLGIHVAATIVLVDRKEEGTERPDFALFELQDLYAL